MKREFFPCFGRVAIVDDKYDEVRKIQSVLTESGVPYIFYDYHDIQDMDINKPEGIRLLILDIRLEDGTFEEKTLLSILASTVERIIPTQNGPYAIILWTNEYSMKEEVISYLNENLNDDETTKPSFITGIDKKEFINKSTDCIADKLTEFYDNQKMLAFLMIIENNVMSVPPNVLKLISYSFVNNLDNDELEKLFVRFARTDEGNCDSAINATKTVLRQISDLIRDRYSEMSANKKVVEKLAELWSVDFSDKQGLKEAASGNSVEHVAIINTVLNINCYSEEGDNVPGKVYKHTLESLNISNEILKKSTISGNDFCIKKGAGVLKTEIEPIEVDITPSCDYAHAKNHMIRTLYGYIVYIEKCDELTAETYIKKIKGQVYEKYVYVTPLLTIKNEICVLIINSKLMDLKEPDYCKDLEYMFRLNDEITNDVRKMAGETISRLGINSL